jgi:hypothetical protein
MICSIKTCKNHQECTVLDILINLKRGKPKTENDCSYFKEFDKKEKSKSITPDQKKEAIKSRKNKRS